MIRLFALLTLSFFSLQSNAGSCPDGSDPVRSISADGTYFVYNCAGSGNDTSSASTNSSSTSSTASNKNTSKGIDRFGGIAEIPEDANPNDETLKYYLFRYLYSFNKYPFCGTNNKELHCEDIPPKFTHSIEPANNPYQFNSDLRDDRYIKQHMQDTALLSYLLYEDGKIVIDEITPEDRFGGMFRDSSKFHSQSVAKTLIGYVAGHAICKGYIDSVDSRLNDWPVLENTLYHNQKLIDVLNMASGTQAYFNGSNRFTNSNRTVTSPTVEDIMKREFKGSKKSSSIYNYNNLNPNVVGSYLIYKLGADNFQALLDDVFKNKARIEGDIFFLKNEDARKDDQSIWSQFYATRYDYLRIAKAMLDDWENDTCAGQYLKTIHERRINKGNWGGRPGTRVTLPEAYAGFFHTGYVGMANRPVMGMDGYGGQTILIDFERGRIIATQAIHDNMKFPQPGGIDFKKISYERIKNGKPSSKSKPPPEPVVDSQQIIKERNAAIEVEKKAKQYWDDYYDCTETTSGKSNIAACIEKNIKKREKSNLETSAYQNIAKAQSEGSELFKGIKPSNTFDGYYGFTNMMPPSSPLGNGTLEINNGIVTISQGSGDLTPKYESFEGRIDQNGDIKANFYFAPCRSCGLEDKLIVFEGNINKKKLSGKYNDSQIYFYLTGKKGDVIKEEKTEKEIIELNTENTQTIEIEIPKNSRTWDYPFLVFDNYEAKGSNDYYKFQSNLKEDEDVLKNLENNHQTGLISYLLFENNKIAIDESDIPVKVQGARIINGLLPSHSMGKSLVSYVTGHAICEGYIESVDERLSGWDVIKNTLYEDQILIDLLNMSAGDQEYIGERLDPQVDNLLKKSNVNSNLIPLKRIMELDLLNSKKSKPVYNYSALTTNVILNYVIHKN